MASSPAALPCSVSCPQSGAGRGGPHTGRPWCPPEHRLPIVWGSCRWACTGLAVTIVRPQRPFVSHSLFLFGAQPSRPSPGDLHSGWERDWGREERARVVSPETPKHLPTEPQFPHLKKGGLPLPGLIRTGDHGRGFRGCSGYRFGPDSVGLLLCGPSKSPALSEPVSTPAQSK